MPYYNYNLVSENDIVVSGNNPYMFSWNGITTKVSIDGDKIFYDTSGRSFNNLDKRIIGKLNEMIQPRAYSIDQPDLVFHMESTKAMSYQIIEKEWFVYSFHSEYDTHMVKVEYKKLEDLTIAKLNIYKKYNFSKDHNEIMASYASIISRIECDCIYVVGKSYGKLLDDYYDEIMYSWKSKKYHKPSNKIICKICSGEGYPKLRPL